MQTQSEFLPSKENQSNSYTRWIWRALQPSLVLCCWKIWRRVAVGQKWGAALLPCTRGTSFLSRDSPDVEKETVPTVSRSESVILGLCTLPCSSPQTTVLELPLLSSKGKVLKD